MTKLYEITAELRILIEQAMVPQPDLEHGPDALAAWGVARADAYRALAECQESLQDKLRAYIAYANELQVERETRAARIDSIEKTVLEPLRRANERDARKQEWLIETAESVIKQFNVPMPLKFAEFTVSLRKQPPRAMVLDPSVVPAEYQRVTPELREPDKKKILDDLKMGVCIPGCALAAPAFKLSVK